MASACAALQVVSRRVDFVDIGLTYSRIRAHKTDTGLNYEIEVKA